MPELPRGSRCGDATLSVVIPVYDERPEDLATTLAALGRGPASSALGRSEVVIVDDGSAGRSCAPVVPGARTRVLRQVNQGRFVARRTGIERGTGEYVLLLDSRVTLDPDGVGGSPSGSANASAWNGHCLMANPESPFARFWNVLTYSAFSDYLDDPRTTSFTLAEYDRYPEGDGHFLAPRSWLLEAIAGFRLPVRRPCASAPTTRTCYARSPPVTASISRRSSPRSTETARRWIPFLRHAIHRGTTFYDGFSRPGTRCSAVVALSFPATATGVALSVRRPDSAAGAIMALRAAGAGFRAPPAPPGRRGGRVRAARGPLLGRLLSRDLARRVAGGQARLRA